MHRSRTEAILSYNRENYRIKFLSYLSCFFPLWKGTPAGPSLWSLSDPRIIFVPYSESQFSMRFKSSFMWTLDNGGIWLNIPLCHV